MVNIVKSLKTTSAIDLSQCRETRNVTKNSTDDSIHPFKSRDSRDLVKSEIFPKPRWRRRNDGVREFLNKFSDVTGENTGGKNRAYLGRSTKK